VWLWCRSQESPAGEIDHFFPLCAGGSDDITNLWFQPATNVWNGKNYGYHEKDDLEAWVARRLGPTGSILGKRSTG
jgi:hypothetical protein